MDNIPRTAAKRLETLHAGVLREVNETWQSYMEPTSVIQVNRRWAKQALALGLSMQDVLDELVAAGRLHVLRIPGGKRFVYTREAWDSLSPTEQETVPNMLARHTPAGQRALRRSEQAGTVASHSDTRLPKFFLDAERQDTK